MLSDTEWRTLRSAGVRIPRSGYRLPVGAKGTADPADPRLTVADGPVVYRLYSAERLLYVGQTINLSDRCYAHQSKTWWPEVVEVRWARVELADLNRCELALIAFMHPTHNIYGRVAS